MHALESLGLLSRRFLVRLQHDLLEAPSAQLLGPHTRSQGLFLIRDLESQWLIIMGYFKPIMVYFGV